MSTWLERVKAVMGPRGYEQGMRRSLQSVILYEARRCVEPQLSNLRPFQRKLAFLDQAHALIESIDFLYPQQKGEILWRTAVSKESMSADVAWKRQQLISKEMKRLSEKIKPFVRPGRSHEESVDLLEQSLYEDAGSGETKPNAGKTVPPNWSHAHNHCLMCFRLYFKGDQPDSFFPKPAPLRDIVVPAERPKVNQAPTHFIKHTSSGSPKKVAAKAGGAVGADGSAPSGKGDKDKADLNERRKILTEVREHLDLLKEFEGIISEEELAQRKRDLYMALPPAPPPAKSPNSNKKARVV